MNNIMYAYTLVLYDNLFSGTIVLVIHRHDQRTGKLTEGIVKKILTNSLEHHHGIKMMVESGVIDRVKGIII